MSANLASLASPGTPARLAPALNDTCQCIWLDRERLRSHLLAEHGELGDLLESRPGLASSSVVFLDAEDAVAMDDTAALLRHALTSDAFTDRVRRHAPRIARTTEPPSTHGMLAFDFHLGGSRPRLIEINTNPGGLLINRELARAVTASCECLVRPLADLVSGSVALDAVPARIVAGFFGEWRLSHGDAPLRAVAIVDDDPQQQYLYPEFLLFRQLLADAGLHARVVAAADLEYREGELQAGGERIDLVYNRVTDFYLASGAHATLREAHESGAAVLTPDPAMHAHWADKRLLAWLRDDALLHDAGLDADERRHLLDAIPPTEIVTRDAADDLWQRRNGLFFKPIDGYGSKAAYRGDKLTRATFERILAGNYVAQALAPTSMRRVLAADGTTELRVDVRNYTIGGDTLLRAARLYRGQTTNFRTPGGGFAPVLTLHGPRRAPAT